MKNQTSSLLLASGDYLAVVRDFALSKGIGLDVLLKDSDIELTDLINPPALSNNLIVSRIGVNLYHALENPISDAVEFGLRMTASTHGSLGLAVQCASDLAEGYQILSEFYNTRLNSQDVLVSEDAQRIKVSLECKEEITREDSLVFNEFLYDERVQHFFDISTLVTIASNTYQAIAKQDLEGVISLHINAPEPLNFPHSELIGINTFFNQDQLELALPIQWKHMPLSIANPELAKLALERCASELKRISPADLVEKVKKRIHDSQANIPKIQEIAEEFYMSSATFKRKLKEQHTTYQTLKNEARLTQAKSLLLENEKPIEDIAEQLGFSDASNFTKAFKTWMGKTPKEFRKSEENALS